MTSTTRLESLRASGESPWPSLPLAEWDDTRSTLQRWMQIVGKTQLALEYSYAYGQEYGVVWWIRSEKEDTRLADLRSLGLAIDVDTTGSLSDVVHRTINWLDRHDDPSLWDGILAIPDEDAVGEGEPGVQLVTAQNVAQLVCDDHREARLVGENVDQAAAEHDRAADRE